MERNIEYYTKEILSNKFSVHFEGIVKKALKDFATSQYIQGQPQWVNCSDRLPEIEYLETKFVWMRQAKTGNWVKFSLSGQPDGAKLFHISEEESTHWPVDKEHLFMWEWLDESKVVSALPAQRLQWVNCAEKLPDERLQVYLKQMDDNIETKLAGWLDVLPTFKQIHCGTFAILEEDFYRTWWLDETPSTTQGQEDEYVMVKASDRMPPKAGRYCVERLGELMMCDAREYANGQMVFTIPNGMPWKGWKEFKWLERKNQ